jgi:hypothetical protein
MKYSPSLFIGKFFSNIYESYYNPMMRYFHRKQNLHNLIWGITLSVFLRSFIAPGYMLSVSADDGLSIIFCNGPAGIHSQNNDHANHHNHHGDKGTQQNHISPACSFWSTSSLLVVAARIEPAPFIVTGADRYVHYQPLLLPQFFDTSRVTRGPPALS